PSLNGQGGGAQRRGIGICTNAFVPSKLKACPTRPAALAVAPPCKVPLFVLPMSWAFPSPGHQLTSPEGGGTHAGAGLTVREATALVTDPLEFVTTTE